MTKIAIIVGANLTFLVFSIPVVTIGPALAALYYVMLETLYRNSALNPFKTFWKGFKENFKKGILTWLIFLAIAVLAYFDIRFSRYAGGIFSAFLVGIYVVLIAAVILYSYLYPVMASFNGTIKELFTNSVYFAFKKPLRMILLVGVEAGAFFLTYFYLDMLPLWAFCWFFFGFGAIAMLGAKLLLPLFKPFQQGEAASAAQPARNAGESKGTSAKTEASGLEGYTREELKLSDDDEDSMDDLHKLDGV